MAQFTVDTHLFRELGALLVGRDSTALVELVKNAYDADATQVTVFGERISAPDGGRIVVTDDGNGMTANAFETGFLRVASRAKELGTRRSPRFSRRYTGAKGIGRLAAHKLAHRIEILSTARTSPPSDYEELTASIDWDRIEEYETLDDLDGAALGTAKAFIASMLQRRVAEGKVSVDDARKTMAVVQQAADLEPPAPTGAIQLTSRRDVRKHGRTGTTITLSTLRRRWTTKEHGQFLEEIQTFRPPEFLSERLPKNVLPKRLLFDVLDVRDASADDPGFNVKLAGDLAPPDTYWQATANAADWVIEIDASPEGLRYGVAPTSTLRKELPEAEARMYPSTEPQPGPFFKARILMRTGAATGAKEERRWLGRVSGVRVYMEGFRVLPYGDGKSDWLSLNRDVVERNRGIVERFPLPSDVDVEDSVIGLLQLPEKHFFGAVFLTSNNALGLEMLVNREGFLPNESFERLVNIVRGGIALATRAHAAATAPRRELRRLKRASRGGTAAEVPAFARISEIISETQDLMTNALSLSESGRYLEAQPRISAAVMKLRDLTARTRAISDEAAMLRILASLGGQLAAFVHELNAVIAMAEAIERAIAELRASERSTPTRRRLAEIARDIGNLRRHLEKQASFVRNVVTPDATRRRRRLSLFDAFESASNLVAQPAERLQIQIRNSIPVELRTPPMFPAEATMLFSNLLTNAVKAAGANGKIRATGREVATGNTIVRVDNTGTPVSPENGERWFRPFESSSATSDSALGYGMGLGLPITRSMLEEYGAEIRFAKPHAGFATAVEITFPPS
jgi:signal transduction histidine kinase